MFAKKRKPNEIERKPIEIVSNKILAMKSTKIVVCIDKRLKPCLYVRSDIEISTIRLINVENTMTWTMLVSGAASEAVNDKKQ